jgi:hypothetical protein
MSSALGHVQNFLPLPVALVFALSAKGILDALPAVKFRAASPRTRDLFVPSGFQSGNRHFS